MTGPATAGPHDLDRAIELVRAAFVQAMREDGLFLGRILSISARAELHIAEALTTTDPDDTS